MSDTMIEGRSFAPDALEDAFARLNRAEHSQAGRREADVNSNAKSGDDVSTGQLDA